MAAVPPSDAQARPSRARPAPDRERERAAWLVLATEGPALELPQLATAIPVRVTGDPRRFRDVLVAERPRIVVCCEPPAGSQDLALVVEERRRRSRLRAVHLAPPGAVEARLAALASGFDDALTTATPAPELAGRLAWLEARAAASRNPGATVPVADGLDLDIAAHELRRGEAPVHLRPKEFGLLAVLATHPGRAYTRRELLDRVWGSGNGSGLRTVDVHVRWLRSKIEPDPERPCHLVTVRGVGYRLDPPPR